MVLTFRHLVLSSFVQVHIVQRGAVRPLIEMLQSPDVQLREMSAFALGRLAQVVIFLFFVLALVLIKIHGCYEQY